MKPWTRKRTAAGRTVRKLMQYSKLERAVQMGGIKRREIQKEESNGYGSWS